VLAVGSGLERLLLTEALRGDGAHVVDARGHRFLFDHHPAGELAPRDVLARAVAQTPAWLDCRHLGAERLRSEFRVVTEGCRAAGLDPANDLLPIAPAAHYAMGGVLTDLDGRASIPGLYAVGEAACTGVHGANRLAGNSLAEALVFGRRAARALAAPTAGGERVPVPALPALRPAVDPPGGGVAGWDDLRKRCSAALGIERQRGDLEALLDDLRPWADAPPVADPAAAELRSAAICARLAATAALLRAESRGVHHRTDHPRTDPRWACVRLRLTRASASA
jgi:L-aspartate oxidase